MAEEYVTKTEVLKLLQEQELRFLKMMMVREQIKAGKQHKKMV